MTHSTTVFTSLEDVKSAAIVVTEGMKTYFPQFQKSEILQVSNLNTKPFTYAYNNSVIAFVDERNVYTIPAIKGIEQLLIESNYQKAYFYVPFSNWDYPVDYKDKWLKLWDLKNKK